MIVGIDLGTTFSLIGYVNAQGRPALCPARNDPQRFQTPSVVHAVALEPATKGATPTTKTKSPRR
jgi:molecular chaperone DnaK (HSP70)